MTPKYEKKIINRLLIGILSKDLKWGKCFFDKNIL